MDTLLLKKIGLTDLEIKAYVFLLEVGTSPASAIAERIGVHRTNAYMVLQALSNKGLVSYVIKESVKYFMATHPQRLLTYLREKETQLRENEQKVQRLIPELLRLRLPEKEKLKVEIYQGPEGMKTLLDMVLKEGKDYHSLGYVGMPFKLVPAFFNHWHKQRVKMGIKRKVLVEEAKKGFEPLKKPLTTIRYLPNSQKPPTSAIIFGNRVWLTISSEESTAVLIESKEVADSYRTYFKFLWGIAKPA